MRKLRTVQTLLLSQGTGLERLKQVLNTLGGYEAGARVPRDFCVCVSCVYVCVHVSFSRFCTLFCKCTYSLIKQLV